MTTEETTVPPYMKLDAIRFSLTLDEYKKNKDMSEALLSGIKKCNMAPYYKSVCKQLDWKIDEALLASMEASNAQKLKEIERDIELNDDIGRGWEKKMCFLMSIGDRDGAKNLIYDKLNDKKAPSGHKIVALFALFRIGYFHGCHISLMKEAIVKLNHLIEETVSCDWSTRNKFKAYEGIWCLGTRNYAKAAKLLVEAVPTFESYELCDLGTIVTYTVYACMVAQERTEIYKNLLKKGVVVQALNLSHNDLKQYVETYYEGQYSDFFVCLAKVQIAMKKDPLTHPHYNNYNQEMRLRAYTQVTQPYQSLTLEHMATVFGVTVTFITKELEFFMAAHRLPCKMDSQEKRVITCSYAANQSAESPEDVLYRSGLYKSLLKKGDAAVNLLKKMTNVMQV